jgi:hypothetical protein
VVTPTVKPTVEDRFARHLYRIAKFHGSSEALAELATDVGSPDVAAARLLWGQRLADYKPGSSVIFLSIEHLVLAPPRSIPSRALDRWRGGR